MKLISLSYSPASLAVTFFGLLSFELWAISDGVFGVGGFVRGFGDASGVSMFSSLKLGRFTVFFNVVAGDMECGCPRCRALREGGDSDGL